jgi:hypothetical protein
VQVVAEVSDVEIEQAVAIEIERGRRTADQSLAA